MNWQESRIASRARFVAKYNVSEAENYDRIVGTLSNEDELAYLSDLERVFEFRAGMSVLDVGAGTGILSKILARVEGLSIAAMEPSSAMLSVLQQKPELSKVSVVQGGCDAKEDRSFFEDTQFDVIVSRQVTNGLFDPLTAFDNWYHWLASGGTVIVIEGLYGRDGWTGIWHEEVDVLPLSACQSMATIPYLLEAKGFRIRAVEMMEATNHRPATRTQRYVVVASKQDS